MKSIGGNISVVSSEYDAQIACLQIFSRLLASYGTWMT